MAGIALGQSGIANPDAVGSVLSNPAGMAQRNFFLSWQPEWKQGTTASLQGVTIQLDRLGYAQIQDWRDQTLVTHTLWTVGQAVNEHMKWGLRHHERHMGSDHSWGIDVGVLWQVMPHLTVGGVAYQWVTDQPTHQPHYQIGWTWHGPGDGWAWNLDGQQQPNQDWVMVTGLSMVIQDDFQLRMGLHPYQFTGGLGTMVGACWVDYAFEAPFSGSDKTHHLAIRLGGVPTQHTKEAN